MVFCCLLQKHPGAKQKNAVCKYFKSFPSLQLGDNT